MLYIVLALGIAVGFAYQAFVTKIMNKALEQPSSSDETAGQLIGRWTEKAGVEGIAVAVIEESSADHYETETRTVVLSKITAYSSAIGAIATAAHEMGHVIQHHTGSKMLAVHSKITPGMNGCSAFSWIVLAIGAAADWAPAWILGVAMICCTLLFAVMTYMVETDASHKGEALLMEDGLLPADERKTVNRIMKTAGGSYLVSALSNSIRLLGRVVNAVFNRHG